MIKPKKGKVKNKYDIKKNKKGEREPESAKSLAKQKLYSRLRGMRDVFFNEYKYLDLILRKAEDLSTTYGFKRIDTPVMERTELYERATGRSTDIVSKEMYSFVDKSGDRVSLRPEATPGLVRAYIEHGMINLPQPVKMFWFGPLFRHDKPQSGRYRQFHQFDLEIFGEESPMADAQLIFIAYTFFKELQIDVQVQINSIGCKECRPSYANKLTEFYKERGRRSKLCSDCKKRLVKNPLRLLDCKEKKCRDMIADAPQIVDSLCEPCGAHFVKVLEYLDDMGVNYNFEPFLVRGLDYYNRTVFEISPTDADGEDEEIKDENRKDNKDGKEEDEAGENLPVRQAALGGGGRYDDLVEHMGGRPTRACGFGIGIERTILKIKENNIPLKEDDRNCIFVAQLGEQARKKAIALFEELRRGGFNVRELFVKNNLKAQLEEANRINAKLALILGQKEILDGTILIRDMDSGIQEVVDYKKVVTELEKRMG
jgi:histidyl-tRNA synthetase